MSGRPSAAGASPRSPAAAQAFGQPRQAIDLRLDVAGAGAAVAGQFLTRPALGGLTQPRLGEAGE